MSKRSDSEVYRAFRDTAKKIKNRIHVDSTSPVKYVGESWTMRHTRLPRLQLPNLDAPPMSVDVEYKVTKKALELTDDRMAKKRRNIDKKTTFINQQWKALKFKEDTLREEFRKFNKFLKANMDKRERALKKFTMDRETNHRRGVEVNNLKLKCDALKTTLANMKKQIMKNTIYERFLERVIQASSGEFKDSCEILPRVEVLMSTKEDIRRRQSLELEVLEDTVGYTVKFVGSKMLTVLSLTGNLPTSKSKYEDMQHRRLLLEYLVINVKATLTNFLADVLVHKNAIDVIYNQMRVRRYLAEDWENDDSFFKIMVIGRTLGEFDTMQKNVDSKSKRRRSSSLRKRKSEIE